MSQVAVGSQLSLPCRLAYLLRSHLRTVLTIELNEMSSACCKILFRFRLEVLTAVRIEIKVLRD
jgi:hypothetical protein